jgi:hypothetical protein
MGRALPLFALLGSIGLGAFALANEPTPRASEAPKSPSVPSSAESSNATQPEGGAGDVNGDAKTKRAAANRDRKPKPTADYKAKDKSKAAQSGNDATLRQLPSPAQRGSE